MSAGCWAGGIEAWVVVYGCGLSTAIGETALQAVSDGRQGYSVAMSLMTGSRRGYAMEARRRAVRAIVSFSHSSRGGSLQIVRGYQVSRIRRWRWTKERESVSWWW